MYGSTQYANTCRINNRDQPAYAMMQIDWQTKQVNTKKIFCSPPVGTDRFGNLLSEGEDNDFTRVCFQDDGKIIFARRIWGIDFNGGDTLMRIFKISTFDNNFNHLNSDYICTRLRFDWDIDWDYEIKIDSAGQRHIASYDLKGQQIYYAVGSQDNQFFFKEKSL